MTTRMIVLMLASAGLAGTAAAQATRGPDVDRLSMLVGTFETAA